MKRVIIGDGTCLPVLPHPHPHPPNGRSYSFALPFFLFRFSFLSFLFHREYGRHSQFHRVGYIFFWLFPDRLPLRKKTGWLAGGWVGAWPERVGAWPERVGGGGKANARTLRIVRTLSRHLGIGPNLRVTHTPKQTKKKRKEKKKNETKEKRHRKTFSSAGGPRPAQYAALISRPTR